MGQSLGLLQRFQIFMVIQCYILFFIVKRTVEEDASDKPKKPRLEVKPIVYSIVLTFLPLNL